MDLASGASVSLDRVHALVARARSRLRLQGAAEGATTASIVASAGALGTVFALRVDAIDASTGLALIAASVAALAAGALFGGLRRGRDEDIARRLDRASGLADRLSTAIAFERELLRPITHPDVELEATRELMRAAMRDAVRIAPSADVAAATPFRRPRDLRIAIGFAALAALAAGIAPHAAPPALLPAAGETATGSRPGAQPNTVELEPDDEAYMRELLTELRATGRKENVKELEDFAAKIEQLLEQAERGELTKEQLLAEMKKAEYALSEHAEPDQAEIDRELAESGKELQKNPMTKALGEALAKNELDRARQELEKLAETLDKGELSEKQQQDLAKTLEQVAQRFDQQQDQRDQENRESLQKKEDAVRALEKKRDQAKSDPERQDAERRLEKEKRELAELKKKQEEKEASAQRESLKRLHKNMDKAAKQLQQKSEPEPDGQDQPQAQQKQASRSLKDAADDTGKVEADQRKRAAQRKASSQMDDLREAMRRAKQRGQRGPQNPFGKNSKNQDFARRAGGGKGQRTAWRAGEQVGKGQPGKGQPGDPKGPGQDGGEGDRPGDPPSNYGDGHDPNLVGDATGKSGNTRDEDVSGVHGKSGPSRREAVLSAAQKGFASAKYREVYADYKNQVEEVIRSEKVPSSYKYYVKKYFTKIKPHEMD